MDIYADASFDIISKKIKGAYYNPISKSGNNYELVCNYDQLNSHVAEALNILYICKLFGNSVIIYNDNLDVCNRINIKNNRSSKSKSLYRLCNSIKKHGNKIIWKSEKDPYMLIVDSLSKY